MEENKKSLYAILIELSESHCRFKGTKKGYADLLKFDLDGKTVSNGNTTIIKDGVVVLEKIELADGREYDLKDIELINHNDLAEYGIYYINEFPYEVIERLYGQYRTSVPTAHSQFSRLNFSALKADDLSMRQLINNMPRIKAQYMLEAYVLLATLNGWLTWKTEKHFFWQSRNHQSLVLFKSWIIKEEII